MKQLQAVPESFAEEGMPMELDWSEQSPHIRSLFHPWQPGDGYDEAHVARVETLLGIRLPKVLRNFYLAWGKREDMTSAFERLFGPEQGVSGDTFIFCEETQAVCFWGIHREVMEEDDPPVVMSWTGPSGWSVPSEMNWLPSYAHLSKFLDDLIYFHAFQGGAVHGGITDFRTPPLLAQQIVWLEEHWRKAALGEGEFMFSPPATLYEREGQAFVYIPGKEKNELGPLCWLATREAEALDEISQQLGITWKTWW